MRYVLASVILLGAATAFLLAPAFAQEKKEVTLTGKILCGKCELAVDDTCNTAIQFKDPTTKKDVVYYFDAKAHDKFHDDICGNAKKGTVTGVLSVVNKKNTITVKTVKFE